MKLERRRDGVKVPGEPSLWDEVREFLKAIILETLAKIIVEILMR